MTTNETTYNGWKNYETWNISLWLNNDEGLYHCAREADTAENLMYICEDLFPSNETPDHVCMDDPCIDWDAIFEGLNEQ